MVGENKTSFIYQNFFISWQENILRIWKTKLGVNLNRDLICHPITETGVNSLKFFQYHFNKWLERKYTEFYKFKITIIFLWVAKYQVVKYEVYGFVNGQKNH